ncbi:MAG: hypothetical protein OJF49_004763 [Ktedonobacterales bacterium]|nr:MAG: hypothetical protein OJF49_004763 [Ktedonobacterales bacterium]
MSQTTLHFVKFTIFINLLHNDVDRRHARMFAMMRWTVARM